jgi:hypothetical protein
MFGSLISEVEVELMAAKGDDTAARAQIEWLAAGGR